MHKYLLNQLELSLTMRPQSAVLIKSGTEEGIDPALPNMNFIRTQHPASGLTTVFLPGSSLKGVLRSHAERIIRTVLGETQCCDPLSKNACGEKPIFSTEQRRQNPLTGYQVYRELCPACKLFGHMVMASHFTIADAFPSQPIDSLPIRQMVAIDRRSGGSVNTFTMETLTKGEFLTRIVVKNFESWQLGLLALVLRDLHLGRLRIGFGKSRGLGLVAVDLHQLSVTYAGQVSNLDVSRYIYGVGELAQAMPASASPELQEYGFVPAAMSSAHFNPALTAGSDWAQTRVSLEGDDAIWETLSRLVPAWKQYAESKL